MTFEKLAVDDNHKTLRLALAMRGGVSLAVWIGGVVAEIDLFRRACNSQIHPSENQYRQERAKRYAEILRDTSRIGLQICSPTRGPSYANRRAARLTT